ncbi:MAG: CoA transferase subunit A [Deltaproteobacteria bacterium]|nr:MAG: CoA transferase subunit A [Deltaproteobacteria bacterium]HDG98402.1 CoA transferase subunit A [Desulfobacterales bacterium]
MSERTKVVSMKEAIEDYVRDGDTVYMGGFIQQQPFAAAHEIIRQGIKNLTISMSAGLILADQLVGAGTVKRLITAFTWNPLPAKAHCFERALIKGTPHEIELEEYSILALALGYFAGALDLPYVATKTILGSGFDWQSSKSGVNNRLVFHRSPINGERVCLIPPMKHDVGIVQVQRSDPYGNAQSWGMEGDTKYGLQSCGKIIICAEEIVPTEIIMRDPNRTIIPGCRVAAVVEEPWGAHPAPVAGYYDIDWQYYALYERRTRSEQGFQDFLQKWVYGVKDRREYLSLLGLERINELKAERFECHPVSYGKFAQHLEVR